MSSHVHPRRALAGGAFLALALLAASPARAILGETDGEGAEPVMTRSYTVVPLDRLEAVLKADRDYLAGMRAHHAGALTMSDEYLADPAASSPMLRELAHAIRHNQRYEIGLLDEVARNVALPASRVNLGFMQVAVQSAATEGLAQQYRFIKYPVPSLLTPMARADAPITVRDVQFAKAMMIHHQGALEMAGAYQADPNGRNNFLGLMNVEIVTDQTQEIALMRRVIAAFPGDAAAVEVPASMVHGMEGMSHGGGHAGHGGMTAAPAGADPHAGHAGMTATPAAADPHAGHAMPPASTAADPHAGHGTPPAARQARRPAPRPNAASRQAAPPAGHGAHDHH